MHKQERALGPFGPLDELDGVPVPAGWGAPIANALDSAWSLVEDEDRTILHPLGDFLARHASELAEMKSGRSAGWRLPPGAREANPVVSTLLLNPSGAQVPGLTRLLLVLVAAAVEAGTSAPNPTRKQLARLASILRGAFDDPDSGLRLVLGDAGSIPRMIRSVDANLAGGDGSVHPGFAAAWKSWIRDLLTRWMLTDPVQISADIRPHFILSGVEGPGAEIGGGPDPDDQTRVDCDHTEASAEPGSGPSPAAKKAKAHAYSLMRGSGGDLFTPSDQLAPTEHIQMLARLAMKAAKELGQGSSANAEEPAALAFVIAGGIRELDLKHVRWGYEAAGKLIAIDPTRPCLYRAVCRPPNAVKVGAALEGWVTPVVDQLAWPLPPSLHEVLRGLCPDGSPNVGDTVFPRILPTAARQFLWGVSRNLAPQLALSPGVARLVMAAELARQHGPEVAQLVLGDSFSVSVAPAHYSAQTDSAVAKLAYSLQKVWFGESADVAPGTPSPLGSRLILTNDAARRWPDQLRGQMRSAAHRKDSSKALQLLAHRDRLAAALCAVSGGRPADWIGALRLDDIVPEYAIAIIRDKANDSLRTARIVATGYRWLADLRGYLDRLIQLSDDVGGSEWSLHAQRVLLSQEPLFSMPEGHGGSFLAADLRQSMPEPLRGVPNHYRHRLNGFLELSGVDPELRHGQLGWVLAAAHVLADMSPWSAKSFGKEMAPILDQYMVDDGWYPPTQRTPRWSWRGVPERPLIDWGAIAQRHTTDHAQSVRRLKARLMESWKEVSDDVYGRLGAAIEEYFPSLHLSPETRRLEFSPELARQSPVEMSLNHYALLCDRVQLGDQHPEDATEGIATRILLYRLVLGARRRGVIRGPLPGRPVLRVTSDPSPFFPGLGLAVRQAEAIRQQLIARASESRAHDAGPLALSCVLALSPYRRLELAMSAVNAANGAVRSKSKPDCVRVPAVVDRVMVPMAFGGLPALLLSKRAVDAPTGRAPASGDFAAWLQPLLAKAQVAPDESSATLGLVESLFQAAGRLELSGPERTTLLKESLLASVATDRSVARDDNWPARTADECAGHNPEARGPVYEDEPAPAPATRPRTSDRSLRSGYARFVASLNPETFPGLIGRKSDSTYGWRGRLDEYLRSLSAEFGERSNLGLLIGFTRHRLRYGGAKKSKLQHATLSWVTRFASDLLAVAGQGSILAWTTEEFGENYLAVLVGKPVTARRQAFDALLPFHRYLMEVHQVPEAPLAELAAFSGERVKYMAPGSLTRHEVETVQQVLQSDLESEQARNDATPEFVRLLALRELMFIILEAAGIRPSSAYGLTYGDLALLGPGRDFVRIHATGGFGRAKSVATLGYIPLEGTLWARVRDRVVEWLDQEKALLNESTWWRLPLFAVSIGEKRRFSRAHLTCRLDELLKWVTADKKAHTYWLRKSRVTARHENAMGSPRAMARDVHAAMSFSGHVLIQTPLESYISDPSIPLHRQIQEGREASRADILAMTNQIGSQLDMAWLRSGGAGEVHRLAVVLDRIGMGTMQAPVGRLTSPPPLRRNRTIIPRHVDTYARAAHRFSERHDVLLHSGLTERQASALDHLAARYVVLRGASPWPLPDLKHKHAIMKPARHLAGTERAFAVLDMSPDDGLKGLADSFMRQVHVSRLYGPRTIMVLDESSDFEAAAAFLKATGMRLMIDDATGVGVLMVCDDAIGAQSHTAAFQWVMSMLWLHARL